MSDDTATTTTTTSDASAGPDLDRPDYWQRPGEWQPEFPGQRPPFAKGNRAAQVSGYRSPRAVQTRAAELLAAMLAELPELDRPRYRFDAEAWAYAEARAQLNREHEATVGMFDGKGNVRSSNTYVRAAERDAAQARDRLGLGPLAEAKLRRDQSAAVAFAGPELLAARMAEGRALVEAAPMAALPTTTDRDPTVDDDTDREGDA